MAKATPRQRWSRGTLISTIAAVAIVGVVTTLAVVADGYDAQEVPRLESSVWVTRDSGQYARVNTDLAEIDTVRTAEDPSGVVQAGSRSLVFTQGYRQVWPIDPAAPIDLVEATDAAEAADDDAASPVTGGRTPAGTRAVSSSGDFVSYLTDTGKVFVSVVEEGEEASEPVPVDPFLGDEIAEGETPRNYVASAATVADDGTMVLYSADEEAVRRYDATTSEFLGSPVPLADAPAEDAAVEIAIVGDGWALSDPEDSRVWVSGRDTAIDTELEPDARLQTSTSAAGPAYLADSVSLARIDLETGELESLTAGEGTPAAPVTLGGVTYAAWLTPTSGVLWTSDSDELVSLATQADELDQVQALTPVFRSNGQRAVLNETASGLLWTVPDGRLVPLEQWSLDDDTEEDAGTVEVEDVAEQEPPVAVNDAFGVRSGELVRLPVLFNDHDPNKRDVLTIAPETVSALSDPAFGDVILVSNNQEAVIRVAAESGTATFSYSVTDGTAISPPATVTLTVVPPDQNSAPVWCGVEACVQEWPTPSIAPGGTVTVPVLPGWVDPEGDLFVLSDARRDDVTAPVAVVATGDGTVAIRHTDPNASDTAITITVSVTDVFGATAEKQLTLLVTSNPTLEAKPIAIVAGVGDKTTVEIAKHVTGGSGSIRVVDAIDSSATSGVLSVVPNIAAGEVDLTASAEGDYLVTYTVQDTVSQAEQSAIIRVSVLGTATPLSMAPLTAFVRPNEDTTVDVLGAVQNTTGRVLIVSEASTGDPALSIGVVGQSRVRVSGSTPDGLPGRIGAANVIVTDGAGATVEGRLTVFLVSASSGVSPIAVPDAVTVRAGTQVDIPVTANDVSPRGERLAVHPTVEGSGTSGELAFSAGSTVRYLAPPVAGVYTVRYSVYLENDPERIDTAAITVTVLAEGSNRAPQPPVLTSRVLAGQSVSIPVRGYGVDPDGDRIVLADVAQPAAGQGVASISAEGDAIVYRAPADGVDGGQVSFGYTVADTEGAEGSGTVRIGVLDSALTDVAPIAYSDYVRVQQNTEAPVTVAPTRNDRDPAQGTLELVELVPNAPNVEGNPEFARLEALIEFDPKSGEVRLRAGDVLGAHSYVYTVRSSVSSSTSQGFIVVNVTDSPSPDHPIVTDTVLTARDRNDLSSGVDVVSGKVAWASGDVSSLSLELWGSASERYEVDGWSISGELPERGEIVPFTVTGADTAGDEVVGHGFLRIPAFDDMRIQVLASLDPIDVAEEASVEFDTREVIDIDRTDTIEVRRDATFAVQRDNATCSPGSGSTAIYAAGREAPWSDSCTVSLRLEGQSRWTQLSVPIAIEPKDPQAILSSVSRTVAPGATETVDLYAAMTTWEGGREGDVGQLAYATSYVGTAFTVTQTASSVSIEARADARPGTRENIPVSVAAFGGLSSAITLVVGVAPVDAPRGATFSQQCTVSAGPSCSISVVGVSGEYDPFAGKTGSGLTVTSVGSGGSVACAVATVSVASESQLVARWPSNAKPTGGECAVPYTVTDAQGRTGQGSLSLDVLGYPQAPSTVTTVAYTGESVTLTVPLGEAAGAHPGVTGVSIWEGGSRVGAQCGPGGAGAYSCVVSGLTNGERHTYTARAENSVGDSVDTSAHTTWAYRAPELGAVSAESIYEPGRTSQSNGVVELEIESGDDTRTLRFSAGSGEINRTGRTTTVRLDLPPGTSSVQVLPVSQFQPPIGGAGSDGQSRDVPVRAAGSPFFSGGIDATATNNTTIVASGVSPQANNSERQLEVVYLAWRGGNAPECRANRDGGLDVGRAEATSTNGTFTGLEQFQIYTVKACVSNGYGVAESGTDSEATATVVDGPDGDATYRVDVNARDRGLTYSYELQDGPNLNAGRDFRVVYTIDGSRTEQFALSSDRISTITAQTCRTFIVEICSDPISITPVTAATTVEVTFPDRALGAEEDAVAVLRQGISSAARGSAIITATNSEDLSTVTYTVSFGGDFSSLASIEGVTVQREVADPEPTPTPDPTDPPTTAP